MSWLREELLPAFDPWLCGDSPHSCTLDVLMESSVHLRWPVSTPSVAWADAANARAKAATAFTLELPVSCHGTRVRYYERIVTALCVLSSAKSPRRKAAPDGGQLLRARLRIDKEVTEMPRPYPKFDRFEQRPTE